MHSSLTLSKRTLTNWRPPAAGSKLLISSPNRELFATQLEMPLEISVTFQPTTQLRPRRDKRSMFVMNTCSCAGRCERAWDALVGGIIEPAVCRSVRKVSFLRDRAARPGPIRRLLLVLRSSFERQRGCDRDLRVIRPKQIFIRHYIG